MTEHWSFSIVLGLVVCFIFGSIAALADWLRRRYGHSWADTVASVVTILVLGYFVVGTCVAVFMALTPVVQNADIEYDSREFLR